MHLLLAPFFLASLAGLALSVIAHVCALVGWSQPMGNAVMGLHGGIFAIWFPAVLVANRLVADYPRKHFWKAALRGCPVWMRGVPLVFFAYALLNFAWSMGNTPGAPKGGQLADAATVRCFSGHWMLFYSAGAAILYSGMSVARHDPQRRCSKGHPVSSTAAFCESCGAELEPLA